MKLVFCTECQDIIRLQKRTRHCKCKKSKGWYLADGLNAVIAGPCIPIGFDNVSFMAALGKQPVIGPGERFEAFIIETNCPTIRHDK